MDRMLDLINVCISLFLTDLVLIPDFAQLMHLPFHLQPTWQPILVREGSEPEHLWNALGGKGEYPREKEIARFTEDPHLFTCVSTEGKEYILPLKYSLKRCCGSALILNYPSCESL